MQLFIDTGLLYYQPQVNGLDYAITREGTFKNPHFKWEPGFTVEIGTTLPHDQWQFALSLTHLHAFTHGEIVETGLKPVWTEPGFSTDGTVDAAGQRWRLHFALIDLALQKSICPSGYLSFSPLLGVRYALVREKYKVIYRGGDLFPQGEDMFSTKNKFWGIGPRFGLDSEWWITGCFGLYNRIAIALLLGEFYVHESEKATVGEKLRLNFKRIYHQTQPLLDLSLGLFWTKGRWTLRGGYDLEFLFSRNQLIRIVDSATPGSYVSNLGDLALQGVRATVEFCF